jgi:hypothetical protein
MVRGRLAGACAGGRPTALKQHFQAVEVSATEAGKAVAEIAGGLRVRVR